MAAGDYINKANYKAMYTGSSWELTANINTENLPSGEAKYLWHRAYSFHSTSFVLEMNAVQRALAKITLGWMVYYYDIAQGRWVLYDEAECYEAWLDYDHGTRKIAHNRTESGIAKTDISNNHDWFVRVEVNYDETSGNEGNYDAYLKFYLGATEMSNYSDSTCDFLWKPGKHIYGMQPSMNLTSSYSPSGTPDTKRLLRGTPISVAAGTARYIYSEG